ncbi:MAG TPA: sigma-54-dependent Fis family transcriptional regulator [Terriglobales bacterium]|nr:sigma-54-dependent Fis family transcriptional regulator [Terriglobales bacterium]
MSAVAPARNPQPRMVVVVHRDPALASALYRHLPAGFAFKTLTSHVDITQLFGVSPVDGVVMEMDENGGLSDARLAALQSLRQSDPDVVLLGITAQDSDEVRSRLSTAGADDVLPAPPDAAELTVALQRHFERRAFAADARLASDPANVGLSFCEMLGTSEPMQRVYDAVRRVAQSTTTVVIRGESGTGKELVARSIVSMGPRSGKPFISVNSAALPETLMESELFGYEKGAFTGAVNARPGQIEMADGGTLFLDEIATLTLQLQSKLLRVLEDRAVQRLGSTKSRKIDFRLLTATHQNLEEMVKEGKFREDLYYRVHVIPITLPALRERPGDIALLTDHFLRVYCSANNVPVKRLGLEALEVMEEYGWPGNVRELQNLVQRLALMVEGRSIEVHHLPQNMLYTSAVRHESMLIPASGIDFDSEMERIEAAYVRAALHRAGGKKVLAAALLHVNPQKMKYLCRKHKLDKSES